MATAGGGTIRKALEVLDSVAEFGRPVRFTELLANSPFPKATLYRFVQTLVDEGMLSYDPELHVYSLGVRLVRLAHSAWAQSSLSTVAGAHLDALSGQLQQTIHLAQLDHAQVLYVDKRNAASPVEMYSDAGKVGPAYCTGVGKAMLAFEQETSLKRIIAQQSFHRFTEHTYVTEDSLCAELAAIRKRGHAFDREEHEPGIICVAVPILTQNGRCLGGLSVTGSTVRTSLSGLEGFVPALQETARKIAQDSEDWRFPQTDNRSREHREDPS